MKKTDEEKTLKWRLSERPTVENVSQLLSNGILTKEEARQIILEESAIKQSDIEDIKSEIKVLRDLILSQPNPQYVQIIRQYQTPNHGWGNPYYVYCSTNSGTNTTGTLMVANGTTNY